MQTNKENTRMWRCKNVANYRKRNNGVKNVVDIISGINECNELITLIILLLEIHYFSC